MEPPPLELLTTVLNLSAKSLAELPASVALTGILVTEFVISLPAPITMEPLELNVLFAVPTMLLPIPE